MWSISLYRFADGQRDYFRRKWLNVLLVDPVPLNVPDLITKDMIYSVLYFENPEMDVWFCYLFCSLLGAILRTGSPGPMYYLWTRTFIVPLTIVTWMHMFVSVFVMSRINNIFVFWFFHAVQSYEMNVSLIFYAKIKFSAKPKVILKKVSVIYVTWSR